MKNLVINSHSLSFKKRNNFFWSFWFFKFNLVTRLFGLSKKDILWTFDDFYKNEKDCLELILQHGYQNITIFYNFGLLGKEDASEELKNSANICSIGTIEDLKNVKKLFPNINLGIHTKNHYLYEKDEIEKLQNDIVESNKFHYQHFQEMPIFFAFPYGKASALCIETAKKNYDQVFMSDNTRKYSACYSKVINRIHIEPGGSVIKFFVKLLYSNLFLTEKF